MRNSFIVKFLFFCQFDYVEHLINSVAPAIFCLSHSLLVNENNDKNLSCGQFYYIDYIE